MLKLNNENSAEHWKFINVTNKTVLDLGCGRWNKIEKVEDHWLTTPEHFIANGAIKVIGVDNDAEEIAWFNNKFNNQQNTYEFLHKSINTTSDIIDLYNKYKPECVKCDIETGEIFLLNLDKETFCSINEYYIETHGSDLYYKFIDIFNQYNYLIVEQIDLTHTSGYCKVIFAQKMS